MKSMCWELLLKVVVVFKWALQVREDLIMIMVKMVDWVWVNPAMRGVGRTNFDRHHKKHK